MDDACGEKGMKYFIGLLTKGVVVVVVVAAADDCDSIGFLLIVLWPPLLALFGTNVSLMEVAVE